MKYSIGNSHVVLSDIRSRDQLKGKVFVSYSLCYSFFRIPDQYLKNEPLLLRLLYVYVSRAVSSIPRQLDG